jgi:Lamin Tail Domain
MKLFWIGRSVSFLFLVIILLVSSCKKDEIEPVVTEQGIFINEVYASGDDWIELYNDLESAKDLTAYAIYDDATRKYLLPSGTSIPAKGFLILNCNDEGTGLNTNFKLASTGETVYLENSLGTLIDKVEFPGLDNGQSYARFPDGSASLAITGNTTKGISNGTSQAPAVAKVNRTPLVPSISESVTIAAELVSNNNIGTVKLFYRLNNASYTTVAMTLSGSLYQATIPAANTIGEMDYYVEVKGTNDKVSYSPSEAPVKTHSYLLNTDVLPQLVINEFMAFNTSCCADNGSGISEFDDWIEIYNKGATAVNIAGMYLSDDKTDPFRHKIPSDNATLTTIQPGGYLVLWADNTQGQGPLHLELALANAGEDVALFYIDGRTIDSYTFGAQSENVSTGRTTDGASTWKTFNTPTQGKTNQ